MTWIPLLLKLSLVVVGIALPAWMLQASCHLCGLEKPRFGKALLTGITAALVTAMASVAFSWTVGLMISWFVSGTLAWGLGWLVAWFATTTVFSAMLRVGMAPAAKVALVQHLIGVGIALLVGLLGYSGLFW